LAHYYSIVVDGKVNRYAAWSYPDPHRPPRIKGDAAFRRGVKVERVGPDGNRPPSLLARLRSHSRSR
jgi:uncharacterized protein (DUF427 family)